MDRVDSIVVGAGVVGLAIARALAQAGREVVVLEAASSFGTGTSSRNSGVIHAGIYYPPGSLKARLCVSGKESLYAYCEAKHVEHSRLGKHIVAADEAQRRGLERLAAQARANGVNDLQWRDAAALRQAEPEVTGVAALFSPSTGVVDAHGYMSALVGDIEAASGAVAYQTPLAAAQWTGDGWEVETAGAEPISLRCRELVNAAGLAASHVARTLKRPVAADVPETRFARGCYFELAQARSPFKGLIYPMPEPGGLGVHATLDLGGRVRFGPDVEWINAPDLHVWPERADAFYDRIRVYWPDLPDGALQAAYAGVRPKLGGPFDPPADFLIHNGGDGAVELFGIESPGLTSSLSLGEEVLRRLEL